jgi:hypothetical protein
MITIITNFLWVLFFEFIPNFFSTSGVVNVVQEYQKKRPWYAIGFAVISGVLTFLSIAALEGRKLLATTQTPGLSLNEMPISNIIIGCLIFTAGIFGAAKYYQWKKTTVKTDIILGVSAALLLSAMEIGMIAMTEGPKQVSVLRMVSHTVAFLIAFPVTVAGLRKTIEMKEGKTLPLLLLVTLIMTAIITAVDYGPFLKN